MKHPRPSLKYVAVKEPRHSRMSFENFTVEDPQREKLGKLEGFILDVDQDTPYYVVVDAGNWFRSKHVLIPIGHVTLDSESKRLITDVPQERIKRFPGFDLALFPTLTQKDLDRMADEIARVCCPDLVIDSTEFVSRLDVWAHYRTPTWWDKDFPADRPLTDQTPSSETKSKR